MPNIAASFFDSDYKFAVCCWISVDSGDDDWTSSGQRSASNGCTLSDNGHVHDVRFVGTVDIVVPETNQQAEIRSSVNQRGPSNWRGITRGMKITVAQLILNH